MKSKWLLSFTGLSGLISVMLGAFAAHGLKATLSPSLLSAFETGVQYQFIHTLMIGLTAILLLFNLGVKPQTYFFLAAICFIIGIFCFSGSLYALALTGIKWFGPITPFGGLTFMIGWCLFFYAAFTIKEVSK